MEEGIRNFIRNHLKYRYGSDLIFCAFWEREDYYPSLLIVPTDLGYRSSYSIVSTFYRHFPKQMEQFDTSVHPYSKLLEMARIGEPDILAFFQNANENNIFGDIKAFQDLRSACQSEEGFDADEMRKLLTLRRDGAKMHIKDLFRQIFDQIYIDAISDLQLALIEKRQERKLGISKQYLSDYNDPYFGRNSFPGAVEALNNKELLNKWFIARNIFRISNSAPKKDAAQLFEKQFRTWLEAEDNAEPTQTEPTQ